MKEQILLNGITNDIAPTLLAGYYKYGVATLITGNFGTSGGAILEIETMQELIAEPKTMQLVGDRGNPSVSVKETAFTVCSTPMSDRGQMVMEPKIAASRGRGKGWQQQLEINDSGTSNTITSVNKDNLLIEPKINLVGQYDSSQNSRVIDTEGISYCMANGHKDGMPKIIEPNVLRQERTEQCKKLRKKNGDKGMKFNQGNKEYNPRTDGISNTLSTSTKDNMLAVPELRMEDGCMVDKEGRRYRIRKLTPTECFRLMDVNDEDIEKMKSAGIAKTNLYKLAGNSIVVSCMFHLFRKLFIEKGNENQQLELF